MIRGLPSHIDLCVVDLERSIAFYDRILGALGFVRAAHYAGGAPCWFIVDGAGGEFSIALHGAKSPGPHDRYSPGLHHLAFHAASRRDVDDFHAFLCREQVKLLDPPAEYAYTPGYYAVFFADPDGMKLELVYEPRFHSS